MEESSYNYLLGLTITYMEVEVILIAICLFIFIFFIHPSFLPIFQVNNLVLARVLLRLKWVYIAK